MLKLYINLRRIPMFITFSLPIHEHSMSLYLVLLWLLSATFCRFQQTSFIRVLVALSLNALFFILSNCKWNCIFNFDVHVSIAIIYRNKTDFCMWSHFCMFIFAEFWGVFELTYWCIFLGIFYVDCQCHTFFLSGLYAFYFPFLPYWNG